MTVAPFTRALKPAGPRARRWVRQNLFSSTLNSILTVVSVLVVGYLTYALGRFVLVDAEWRVIEDNRRLLFVGRFPTGDEWRLWPPLYLAAVVGGLAGGIWATVSRRDLAWIAAGAAFMFIFLAHGTNGLLLAGAGLLAVGGYVLAHSVATSGYPARIVRWVVITGSILLIPFTLFILNVAGGPSTELWGGYFVNVLIAAVAITFSLPLGIVLALARRSPIRTLKYPAIAFIEVIRAGPLVVWLFISRFVLPDFMPPIFGLDQLDLLLRVMIMFTIFTSAYIAEIVRGGLQSVPRGQIEAGEALGLGTINVTVSIVLPQALRAVIPALVGQVIALWKDTSLVFIVGLLDFTRSGNATLFQSDFSGRQKEVYVFIGFGFWIVSFAMSRLSLRVERSLGIGSR
jgi:general L-amino acid transport system permease protein